ncbi:MAG: T9SS type A sorting domain-containing protein, partial [Pedobacter sp.]
LNIKLNSLDATSLQIMDVAGKIVYKQKIQSNNAALTLNLSGYNKGLYLIQLNTENKVYTEKLVIK